MHRIIPVNESCHVGQVRRAIQELADRTGASKEVGARAALVGTELSTNLLKHSSVGGEVLYRALFDENRKPTGIEILALDKGRGIPNISKALNDGYSTAGSPGTGMGAIRRMSDAMEIFSAESHGTVISTQICTRIFTDKIIPPRIRSICTPLDGFDISGDYCVVIREGTKVHIIMSDGLGHGDEAAEASHRAAEVFRGNIPGELPDVMTDIHEALAETRGAAVALASFDSTERTLKYVAVGNIEARFCTENQ